MLRFGSPFMVHEKKKKTSPSPTELPYLYSDKTKSGFYLRLRADVHLILIRCYGFPYQGHGIVRCPLGLNNARFTHRTNIAIFLGTGNANVNPSDLFILLTY